ncbi:polysaccharide deacetylase family protein [Candidatus Woesearchaeota archaeon]|nr:polysaccharide deacetylase family protein [Candidatus Woesearchaeota archaeon]
MITPRMMLEAGIHKTCGSAYYNALSLPKIRKEGLKWKDKWKGRKACLCISYDPDETKDVIRIPKLLDQLDRHGLKASFAAVGMLVERHTDVFKDIIARGHELLNHTYSHPDNPEFNPDRHFHKISKEERLQEIRKCHAVVKELLGYDMKGFRIPHFGNQFIADIYPMIRKMGYSYSSSTVAVRTKSYGFPYKMADVFELPMVCCPRHPFCIFDTSHAFRSRLARHSKKDYLETFGTLLDIGMKNSMFLNLYQDPQDLHKFDYDRMLGMISAQKDELLMTTYRGLVKHLK